MGSWKNFSGDGNDLSMIEVQTANLKQRLNRIYDAMRAKPHSNCDSGLFEYLWDLKELALVEGRASVQVPTKWLQELETELSTNISHTMH